MLTLNLGQFGWWKHHHEIIIITMVNEQKPLGVKWRKKKWYEFVFICVQLRVYSLITNSEMAFLWWFFFVHAARLSSIFLKDFIYCRQWNRLTSEDVYSNSIGMWNNTFMLIISFYLLNTSTTLNKARTYRIGCHVK